MNKKIINVTARSWRTVLDTYDNILKVLDAPEWHGISIDALVDSMIYGGINGVGPPYVIRFHDSEGLPTEIAEEIEVLKDAISRARLERRNTTGVDVDVELEIVQGGAGATE